MSKKKKITLIIIIAVIVAALLVAAGFFLYNNLNYTNEADSNSSSDTNIIKKAQGYDFDKLAKTYPDICAWLDVPNTNVTLPIVQNSDDDSYYLNHDAQKNLDQNGAAYIELANSKDFTDPVTVVYGHNMNDGSMFASIHNFENPQFFNENPKFYIYTPGHKLTYTVLCASITDDKHILNSHNFNDKTIFLKYINDLKTSLSTSKNTRSDVYTDEKSKIVQLSTCMSDPNLSNQRYILTGVLTDDQATS